MGKQRTIENWQSILGQFQASGLTVTQFCKQHTLAVSNFYKWRKRIEQLPATDCDNNIECSGPTDNWQAMTLISQSVNSAKIQQRACPTTELS